MLRSLNQLGKALRAEFDVGLLQMSESDDTPSC